MTQTLAPSGWTASQKAPQPFVFRSGGVFGSGTKVRTVQAAVRHMDRYPEDGIYHLRNGTLAKWLDDQGAGHLAREAREVVRGRQADSRVALETFLIGTGLVRRPRLSLHPKKVNLRYIPAGGEAAGELRIAHGRGRGYLFGSLRSRASWLRTDPTEFKGQVTKIVVCVDTAELPIDPKAQQGEILVESSSSVEPVIVPVRFTVAGNPSPANRFLWRPLTGLVIAGLLGMVIGWLLGLSGPAVPPWFRLQAFPQITAAMAWAWSVGALWAILGAARGFLQPPEWPVHYTVGRWLVRTLIWGVALELIAIGAIWSWAQVGTGSDRALAGVPWSTVFLAVLACAVVPAIAGEIWNTRARRMRRTAANPRPLLRPGLLVAATMIACLLLVTGSRLALPAVQELDTESAYDSAQVWTQAQLTQVDAVLNDFINRIYLRYYDRRARAQPAPSQPSARGSAGSGWRLAASQRGKPAT